MKKIIISISFTVFYSTIIFAQDINLKTGIWRAKVELQGKETPFGIDLQKENNRYVAYILNAEERLKLEEIEVKGDSIRINLHIFDAVLAGKIQDGKKIVGQWIKYGYKEPQTVPFSAEYGLKYRFEESNQAVEANFNGKWSVTFTDDKGVSYPSVGIFQQKGKKITGTFLTETGDYRYLEGLVEGKQIRVSTFDGSHGFLFQAEITDNQQLKGDFWAGKLGHETFVGVKNDTATLPDANALTYLKPGYDKLAFSFPNLNNQKISLSDKKYEGKVVIIQLLGSWCPNCMDETAFLSPWFKKNQKREVEIIGLAYERSPNFEEAKTRVEKMKNRYQIDYELLIAGTNNKQLAGETLPMLNKILAFPTTIIVDKQGKVRRIHTGFTGPGTGVYYEKFKREFNQLIDKLLAEKI